eukprot:486930-Karenia_brevis.AAC.1
MATTVPHKGGRGMFAVDRCLDIIDESGNAKRDISVNSDTEGVHEYVSQERTRGEERGQNNSRGSTKENKRKQWSSREGRT